MKLHKLAVAGAAILVFAGAAPAFADSMGSSPPAGTMGGSSMSSSSATQNDGMASDHMAKPKKHAKKTAHAMSSGAMATDKMSGGMNASDSMKGNDPSTAH